MAADWENRPVGNIQFSDALRFVNWLNNGQPTGNEDLTTTEDGSYYLNGAISWPGYNMTPRTSQARYVIPTANEWYKAAFHKNNGATGDYWDYATGSDTLPNNNLINPDPGNNANYSRQAGGDTIGSPYYRTVVGEFENSESPYGTFDQNGNVWEYNETTWYGPHPGGPQGLLGGSFYGHENWLISTAVYGDSPPGGWQDIGFRVTEVPEPSSLLMGGAGLLYVMLARRMPRKSRSTVID